MNHLYQLVYSSSRTPSCNDKEIEKILDSCQRNNPGRNITGILLHSNNSFIQYIEGDKDIIKLYDLIKNDSRHNRVVLLSYGPLKERIFPSWHMGYKDISRDELVLLTEGTVTDNAQFSSIVKGNALSENTAVKLLTKFFDRAQ